uniref:Protein Spindly n=1 Tax=Cynoglossus semilaevis TaxID=244447 RepID=A0A3P8X406_CYNSE
QMAAEVQVERLHSQLRETQKQLQQAAQAGLDLLQQQTQLENRLEGQRVEMTNALEALEQDKYSLQKEVDLKTRMLESLRSDYDCLKNQQTQHLLEQQQHLERNHSLAVSELNNKVVSVVSALDESQLNEKQLKQKLEIQTESLDVRVKELQALSDTAQNSMSSEMLEVEMKISALETLEQTLQEYRYQEQQMALTTSSLQRQLERVTEEKEEREKEAVSWFNALEKSRDVNRDLQVQLDHVLQQAQDPNSRGNSLFAELEDKRAEMERQLISTRVQYQSLQKQHAFTKQQLQHMKVQVATLMQLQGSRTDSAQMERLQSMLCEKNSEIQNLMSKLQRLERVEMVLKAQHANAGAEGQDETYYTDLLKMKLNNTVKDAERLGGELSLQRMKSLSESQRALDLERKLFTSDRLLKQVQSQKIKLQLRVEELEHKYEPKGEWANRGGVDQTGFEFGKTWYIVCRNKDERDVEEEEGEASCGRPCSTQYTVHSTQYTVHSTQSVVYTCNPVFSSLWSRSHLGGGTQSTENQQPERRRRHKPVETIHVNSKNSLENQCAQQ